MSASGAAVGCDKYIWGCAQLQRVRKLVVFDGGDSQVIRVVEQTPGFSTGGVIGEQALPELVVTLSGKITDT